jgi:hypothetical protein
MRRKSTNRDKAKSNIKINDNTKARVYEIAMADILEHLKNAVGSETNDYFLEHFCRMFKIDYTTISIIKNMYASKIKATKREKTIFAMLTGVPFLRLHIDYRTLRKYMREININGGALFPHIVNEFMKPSIKSFVDSYVKLMYDDLFYIKNIGEIDNHAKTE